ncbi:MAG: hypothetical protein K8T10_18530 [Candidatus Eremiobacteraeota bacterium]|nr:hypothetical protein [Candidatus Eremiobacteraeota bacterium]
MKRSYKIITLVIIIGLIFTLASFSESPCKNTSAKKKVSTARMKGYVNYKDVVQKTVRMVSNQNARKFASKYGLNILNVTWEDTGRFKGSSVGPNISDMTIQVQMMDPQTEKYSLYCMPVIRFPNFSDKTCDVPIDRFYLLVGNEDGKSLSRITLKKYLRHLRWYLTKPKSWKGNMESLLAKRDKHVLVSAQACFLPIPKKGKALFNPVLFNYQSYSKNPAVLTILATREGTSATIIDNKRDAFHAGRTWGQRLFFNLNGDRTSLTGERLSDFIAKKNGTQKKGDEQSVSAGEEEGLNMVLLIQVPLKHKPIRRKSSNATGSALPSAPMSSMKEEKSDVENAVIGHGKVEGPFTEIDNLKIERDERFPVRVTVQFYKATSNGVVSKKDMSEIAKQIKRVYDDADYVGSLVVDGDTQRPTEHSGPKYEPPDWWDNFWNQYEKELGMSREDAIKMLKKIYGPNWKPRSKADLKNKLRKIKK